MTFLHPLVLLGLAAAAIPALLHLLERRLPLEVDFPALRYLSEAERQSARRLKLQHLLLLALRTALIALVVTAAARPLVPVRGGGGSLHQQTALAVILDNSPSSSVVIDGRPLLDRLRVTARSSLLDAGPDDHLWLMLADGVLRRGTRGSLARIVDSAGVASRRLDLSDAVERAARVVDGEPVPAREVHVVSELQRTALGATPQVPRDVRVLALAPLASPPANLGIGSVIVSGGAVTVSVVGTKGTSTGAVTVRVRGRTVGHGLAGPGAGVAITLPPLPPGWWVGDVELDPDELRADDRRMFVWHVAPPAAVRAGPDVGPFVSAALNVLRDARRIVDGNGVTVGTRPGSGPSVVLPPSDQALVGETNRSLEARGVKWRYWGPGTPGVVTGPSLPDVTGFAVARRYRLAAGIGAQAPAGGGDGAILATVNDEPWLVRDGDVVLIGSRLDTAWTTLPASTGFVPFVDEMVNQLVRGEAAVTQAEGPVHVEFQVRGVDTVGATVFGPDARESDLTPATPAVAARALGGQVLDESHFAAERFAGTHRSDASGLLLALALLVACAELGVATLTR